jgi:hypothetical protein
MKSMCVHAGVITSLVSTQSVSQLDTQKQAQEEATCIHGAVCGHK